MSPVGGQQPLPRCQARSAATARIPPRRFVGRPPLSAGLPRAALGAASKSFCLCGSGDVTAPYGFVESLAYAVSLRPATAPASFSRSGRQRGRCRKLVLGLPRRPDRLSDRTQEGVDVGAAEHRCCTPKHALPIVPMYRPATGLGRRGQRLAIHDGVGDARRATVGDPLLGRRGCLGNGLPPTTLRGGKGALGDRG